MIERADSSDISNGNEARWGDYEMKMQIMCRRPRQSLECTMGMITNLLCHRWTMKMIRENEILLMDPILIKAKPKLLITGTHLAKYGLKKEKLRTSIHQKLIIILIKAFQSFIYERNCYYRHQKIIVVTATFIKGWETLWSKYNSSLDSSLVRSSNEFR